MIPNGSARLGEASDLDIWAELSWYEGWCPQRDRPGWTVGGLLRAA
jgi:hypothetical protein